MSRLGRIILVALTLWGSTFIGLILRGCVIPVEQPICEEVYCGEVVD